MASHEPPEVQVNGSKGASLRRFKVLIGQRLVPVLIGEGQDAGERSVRGWRFGGQLEAGGLESEAKADVLGVIVGHGSGVFEGGPA